MMRRKQVAWTVSVLILVLAEASSIQAQTELTAVTYDLRIGNHPEPSGTATCIDSRGFFLTAAHIFAHLPPKDVSNEDCLVSENVKITLRRGSSGTAFEVVEVGTLLPHYLREATVHKDLALGGGFGSYYDLSILRVKFKNDIPRRGFRAARLWVLNNSWEAERNFIETNLISPGFPSDHQGRMERLTFTMRDAAFRGKYIRTDETKKGFSGASLYADDRILAVLRGEPYFEIDAENLIDEKEASFVDPKESAYTFFSGKILAELYQHTILYSPTFRPEKDWESNYWLQGLADICKSGLDTPELAERLKDWYSEWRSDPLVGSIEFVIQAFEMIENTNTQSKVSDNEHLNPCMCEALTEFFKDRGDEYLSTKFAELRVILDKDRSFRIILSKNQTPPERALRIATASYHFGDTYSGLDGETSLWEPNIPLSRFYYTSAASAFMESFDLLNTDYPTAVPVSYINISGQDGQKVTLSVNESRLFYSGLLGDAFKASKKYYDVSFDEPFERSRAIAAMKAPTWELWKGYPATSASAMVLYQLPEFQNEPFIRLMALNTFRHLKDIDGDPVTRDSWITKDLDDLRIIVQNKASYGARLKELALEQSAGVLLAHAGAANSPKYGSLIFSYNFKDTLLNNPGVKRMFIDSPAFMQFPADIKADVFGLSEIPIDHSKLPIHNSFVIEDSRRFGSAVALMKTP